MAMPSGLVGEHDVEHEPIGVRRWMGGVVEHLLATAEEAHFGEVVEAQRILGRPGSQLFQQMGASGCELALPQVESHGPGMVGREVDDHPRAPVSADIQELANLTDALT